MRDRPTNLRTPRALFAALLALVGCEEQPSKLDGLPDESDVRWAESQAWVALEERALPMSTRNDLLQTAVAIPDRGTIDERAAALVAWMEASGSVPVATTMAALNSPAFDFYTTRIIELVKARPDDDRVFEAALYAAWKMRRDGTGYLAAMLANAITTKLAALRDAPPPFAAKYAPKDEEVFRLFASEAMFARRVTFELDDPESGVEIAMWREFANAPTERAAFLAFVGRTIDAHPKSLGAGLMRKYANGMFAAVDDYQKWLTRGSSATPAP